MSSPKGLGFPLARTNIMIREDQRDACAAAGINISALTRDAIDAALGDLEDVPLLHVRMCGFETRLLELELRLCRLKDAL
jgi:hypothetical protein